MLELRDVSLSYAGAHAPIIQNVNLSVSPGEHVALVGANGSGKTSLARIACGLISPSQGVLVIDDTQVSQGEAQAYEESRQEYRREYETASKLDTSKVGLVCQDPTTQIVSSSVMEEVAFGPCNLGLSEEEVSKRVHNALVTCGIEHLVHRGTNELSGGEQQLLAIAGIVAMRPNYIVLDEPSSHLDTSAHKKLRQLVRRLLAEKIGVLEITHKLEDLLIADCAYLLHDKTLTGPLAPSDFVCRDELLERLALRADAQEKLLVGMVRAGWRPAKEIKAESLVDYACSYGLEQALCDSLSSESVDDPIEHKAPSLELSAQEHAPALELQDAQKSYYDTKALNHLNLPLYPGAITLVLGPSGAGKSSAMQALAGVVELDDGAALIHGQPVHAGEVGLAFQRPEEQLFCSTVLDDVAFGPLQQGLSPQDAQSAAEKALRKLGVEEELWQVSPFKLSGGQARCVALAGVIARRQQAYVFDEPSSGLDGKALDCFIQAVRDICAQGAAVAVVSHELSLWLELAHYAGILDEGRLLWFGRAQDLFDCPDLFEQASMEVPLVLRMRELLTSKQAQQGHGSRNPNGEGEPDE